MGSNGLRPQQPTDESVRYVLDRLVQVLTTELLPILKAGYRVQIVGDQSGQPGEPVKWKITKFVE